MTAADPRYGLLPDLPTPAGPWHATSDYTGYYTYTADQMLAYAEQCIAHARPEAVDALLCQVYCDAYHAGHHDTVEGDYIDVLPVDRDSYWSERVAEYLTPERAP